MALRIYLIRIITGLVGLTAAYSLFSAVSEFQTIVCWKDSGKTEYLALKVNGTERMNPGLNRLSMLSENQANYATPESACGPTALLNIIVWYEKFGLLPPLYRDANTQQYKLKLFREIDRRLSQQAAIIRTEEIGVSSLDIAIVIDSIVSERTQGALRIHTDIINAPLSLTECLETTKNFRSGYLIVTPKDPTGDKPLNEHAAVIIRTDRAGYITLATWGQHYHGLLKKRADGQWFIPQNSNHMELKVKGLVRFIPYNPLSQ